MFNGIYLERNFKKIKMIIDHFGHNFFHGKTVLDLGCGHGDIGAAFYRLGAKVTCVDARAEHVKLAAKKYPGIGTMCVDLDKEWPFQNFDLILNLDLISHLKNFEAHFKNVCLSAKYIALECAVCDSNDPYLCQVLTENKFAYDWSYNGFSSRPTAAMIERILTEYGFEFKRYDYSKLNLDKSLYDWRMSNTGNCDVNKRRFWIAKKKASAIETVSKPLKMVDNTKSLILTKEAVKNSVYPPLVSFQPPILTNNGGGRSSINNSVIGIPKTVYHKLNSDPIRNSSKEFALIHAEKFTPPTTFPTSAVILPSTIGSRMWVKKIAPFFPNVKVHKFAATMFGFNKSHEEPSLAMCSIYNLYPAKRIWIEEWSDYSLSDSDVAILKNCSVIITPSLINAQQILQAIPNANVKRMGRPWPLLNIQASANGNYHLYFEKNPEATQLLIDAWDAKFGKLYVVNSSIKLPEGVRFISDGEDYESLNKIIYRAKSIIDIADNTYYDSGLISLAKAISLPVVTNNYFKADEGNHIAISQDKMQSNLPSSEDINTALKKLHSKGISYKSEFNPNYNNLCFQDIRSLLEVLC